MQDILRHSLKLALVSALVAGSAFAAPQSQDPPAPAADPAKTPPAQQTQQQSGSQPVQQKDTVTPKNSKEESELAGVMAHEIAHVAARHGTKNATKGEILQWASIPAMIFIPYSMAGYAMYQGLNLAIPLTFLKFSRDAEREADFLGLQYMYKTGYDPNSYVTFFERIQADEKRRPGTIPKVFSTHPPTPDRIENTQKEIARILPAKQEYLVTTSEFDTVKARLRNIMFSRKVTDNAAGKPTLRTKTEHTKKQPTGSDPNSSDDDRPTLKRRPDSQP